MAFAFKKSLVISVAMFNSCIMNTNYVPVLGYEESAKTKIEGPCL